MTEQDNKALLTELDDTLYSLLQSHLFFQEAVLNLASNGDEPTWLAGATAVQQWLKQSSHQFLQQFEAARHTS